MVLPKIEEKTLYEPIIDYLNSIGFDAIGETKVATKHPDILFKANSVSFVVEVKIGKPDIGLKAVAQASDYAKKLKTQNIVILIYPEKFRNLSILDFKIVKEIALNKEIDALVLTEYWTESLKDTPIKIFQRLKSSIMLKKIRIDFKTIVNLIGNYVRDLNSIIYQIKTEELIAEVVNKLDLFSSIGEIKDKETAKKQVMNLASFLLFNQLLFYHIYKRKTKTSKLIELVEINRVRDLQSYFDAITDIDYQSIYRVNILGHIPEKPVVIESLNEIIKSIKHLRAEHITDDLAGRFFHDLIPFEVRKVLAAFYTNPVAAELLAGLTIDFWDESVTDPACGSGTLLVSSYKRKQELYKKLFGFKDLDKIHKKFIEKDITGIDIMPFAAHITTLNLATQNIEQKTDVVRIATKDSLSLSDSLKTEDFKKKGIKISSYTEEIQQTLFRIGGAKKIVRQEGALSPRGKGEEFYLTPVDVVIMNPPFTHKRRLTEDMKRPIARTWWTKLGKFHYWAHFMFHVPDFLKENGKIGAVLPLSFLSLIDGTIVREQLNQKKGCKLKYVVKSMKDIAFSESAKFRDYLIIMDKDAERDHFALIYLLKSMREMSVDDAKRISNKITSVSIGKNYEDEDVSILWKKENKTFLTDALWKVVELNDPIGRKINNLYCRMIENNKNLIRLGDLIPEEKLTYFSPTLLRGGARHATFISREEATMSRLLLIDENDKFVKFRPRNTNIEFTAPKKAIISGLRSGAYVSTIKVQAHDYIIKDRYSGFEDVERVFTTKIDFETFRSEIERTKGKLAINRRFDFGAEGFRHFCFYSKDGMVTTENLWTISIENDETAKILALWFNSVPSLVELIFSRRKETRGSFSQIDKYKLLEYPVIDVNSLSEATKSKLLNVFQMVSDRRFPSLTQQFENLDRKLIDTSILSALGFEDKEIENVLSMIYRALREKIDEFGYVMRQ